MGKEKNPVEEDCGQYILGPIPKKQNFTINSHH